MANAEKIAPRIQEPTRVDVSLSDLVLDDPRLQMRTGLDEAHAKQFRDAFAEGDEVPRVRVWSTPEGLLPSDGYHRIEGAKLADMGEIPALLFEGSVEEAILDAAMANARHGLRRDEVTVRNAIWAAMDVLGHNYTVGSYKKLCGTTHDQARKYRDKYIQKHNLEVPAKLKGLDDRWYSPVAWRREAFPPVEPEVVSTLDPSDPRIPTTDDEIPEDADVVNIVPRMPGNEGRAPANGKPTKEAKAPAPVQDDGAFLESLARTNGKPALRDILPEAKVQGYEREALAYRDLMQSPEAAAFFARAERVLRIERGDRGKGPLTRLVAGLMLVEHPRDWTRCGKCRGTGRLENGPCPTCKDQAGYVI